VYQYFIGYVDRGSSPMLSFCKLLVILAKLSFPKLDTSRFSRKHGIWLRKWKVGTGVGAFFSSPSSRLKHLPWVVSLVYFWTWATLRCFLYLRRLLRWWRCCSCWPSHYLPWWSLYRWPVLPIQPRCPLSFSCSTSQCRSHPSLPKTV
jgi:hypothetical protein